MGYAKYLYAYLLLASLIKASSSQLPCGDVATCIADWSNSITPITDGYYMDSAELYIKSTLDTPTIFKWQHGECHKCALFEENLVPHGNWSIRLQSKYTTVLEVFRESQNQSMCEFEQRLSDQGEYWLIISNQTAGKPCQLELNNDPYNQDLNVLWAFLIFLGLAVIWILLSMLFKRGKFDPVLRKLPIKRSFYGRRSSKVNVTMEMQTGDNTEKAAVKPVKKKRLMSLDSFRGLSLVIMMFVNTGGGGYYYFEHAVWNGLTVGDLVFPWFIFMMGTSMAFSFRGIIKRDTPTWSVVWKIVWRSIKLFALGIFMGTHWENNVETMRITGVLQRFSLTYLITALVHYPFAKRAAKYEKEEKSKIKVWLGDLLPYWIEWIIMLAILGAFLALTYALPVPGCPTGYVGPGGMHDGGKYFDCVGGAAGYIDRVVLTKNHMYNWPTSMDVYKSTQPYDPEGILGILSCVFLCYLGLQCGKIVVLFQENKYAVTVRWLIWGVVTGGVGTLLCLGSQEDGWVPLNKNLWSVSYILVMSGTAFIFLIPMYWIIDVLDIWNGAPFIYPGMNSIVVYFCSGEFCCNFPVQWQMPDPYTHWKALFLGCWASSFWTLVAYILYKKKIFVAL